MRYVIRNRNGETFAIFAKSEEDAFILALEEGPTADICCLPPPPPYYTGQMSVVRKNDWYIRRDTFEEAIKYSAHARDISSGCIELLRYP